MRTKTCLRCAEDQPITSFYRHPRMADGRLNFCKRCKRKEAGEHRLANIERLRQYDRDRATPKRTARWQASSRKWVKKFPGKRRANTAVGNALRDGRLTKSPCKYCGEEKVEAHHPDYRKKLEVRWVCKPCHMSLTAEENGKTPWRLIELGKRDPR